MKESQDHQKDIALKLTLEELKKKFPGKTMLNIEDTAQAYGFKSVQSIYNSMRKGAKSNLPKPIKRCGRLFWNLIHIAKDQTS